MTARLHCSPAHHAPTVTVVLALVLGLAACSVDDTSAEAHDTATTVNETTGVGVTDGGTTADGCVQPDVPAYSFMTPEGQMRTRGLGRVALAGVQDHLVAVWSEVDAEGRGHLLVGIGDGGPAPFVVSEAWAGDGVIHDASAVALADGAAAVVFNVRVGEFGEPGFVQTAWSTRVELGDVPVVGSASTLRADTMVLQAVGDENGFLLVDLANMGVAPMAFGRMSDDGVLTPGAQLSADLLAAGIDWAALAQVGGGWVVLSRDGDGRIHHRALALDGKPGGDWSPTEASLRFAGPKKIAAVGEDAVALIDTEIDEAMQPPGHTLVATVLAASDGALRGHVVLASGDFHTVGHEALVSAGGQTGVFYASTVESSDDATVHFITFGADGGSGTSEDVGNFPAYRAGAEVSGILEGSSAALGDRA